MGPAPPRWRSTRCDARAGPSAAGRPSVMARALPPLRLETRACRASCGEYIVGADYEWPARSVAVRPTKQPATAPGRELHGSDVPLPRGRGETGRSPQAGRAATSQAGGAIEPARNLCRLAAFADKLLRGATTAELPIEQPTQFELVVNLRTAAALGITLPSLTLLLANRRIE